MTTEEKLKIYKVNPALHYLTGLLLQKQFVPEMKKKCVIEKC